MVNAPSGDVYYGGKVSGPIFKQIADRVYATEMDIHTPINSTVNKNAEIPVVKYGSMKSTLLALQGLALSVNNKQASTSDDFVKVITTGKEVSFEKINPDQQLSNGIMPDLSGMGIGDVLFLLENRGYRVKLKGCGSVTKQSILPGQPINKNSDLIVELSI